jgi:hypothetical protein
MENISEPHAFGTFGRLEDTRDLFWVQTPPLSLLILLNFIHELNPAFLVEQPQHLPTGVIQFPSAHVMQPGPTSDFFLKDPRPPRFRIGMTTQDL